MFLFQPGKALILAAIFCTISACAVTETVSSSGEGEYVVAPQYAQEIADLGANESVQMGLAHIIELEPRLLADLIELTEIPAPPFA